MLNVHVALRLATSRRCCVGWEAHRSCGSSSGSAVPLFPARSWAGGFRSGIPKTHRGILKSIFSDAGVGTVVSHFGARKIGTSVTTRPPKLPLDASPWWARLPPRRSALVHHSMSRGQGLCVRHRLHRGKSYAVVELYGGNVTDKGKLIEPTFVYRKQKTRFKASCCVRCCPNRRPSEPSAAAATTTVLGF
jgi:hypothetical protein